jgi:L-rhamnose mutarotase
VEVIEVAGDKSRTMEEVTKSRKWQRWWSISSNFLTSRAEKARDAVRSEDVDLKLLEELAKGLE